MKKGRWEKIESILDTALTLSGDSRTQYINTACGGDNDLLNEVYDILRAMEESEKESFLQAASDENRELLKDLTDIEIGQQHDLIGLKIGSFRVTELIGEGGMGSVYKAEREDGEFDQQVAIKIVQPSHPTKDLISRFHMERKILAGLHHPNIASLYDGGITGDGIPYLVMEYVKGIPIDRYCDENKLSIPERIELFLDVCKAVQHAHSNLVIHRDLKAENIYVTSQGQVKVLDFGIAKLADPEMSEQDLLITRPGQKLWTPNYASPEQVKGTGITTSADIYSLGVLLYKLMTGQFPIDLKNKKMSEIGSLISEQSPLKPSESVLNTGNSEPFSLSGINKWSLELKGDIDAIILKALRKEAERRYLSAEQFKEDLQRHLDGFPVLARPDRYGYLAAKFYKRNKVAVSSVLLLFIIAVSAAVISTDFALEKQKAEILAQEEAAEARRQTEIANTVNLFLQQIIGQADPLTNPNGQNLTLMEAVELANGLVEESFSEQPEVEAAVRYTLGVVDMNLGRLERSIDQLNQALVLAENSFGKGHRQTMEMRSQLGLAYIRNGMNDEAQKVLEAGLEEARNARVEDYPASAMVLNELGLMYLYRGDGASAEPYLRESASQKEQVYDENNPDYLTTLHNLSGAMMMQGKLDEATELATDVLERRKIARGEFHPQVAQSLNVVAHMLMQAGKYSEALTYREQDLEMRQKLYEGDHPDKARAMHNIANLYLSLDEPSKALPMEQDALEMWKRTLPANHPDIMRGTVVLARIHGSLGEFDKETPLRDDHLLRFRRTIQPGSPELAPWLMEASVAHLNSGNLSRAASLSEEAMENFKQNFGSEHWQYFIAMNLRGYIAHKEGQTTLAREMIGKSTAALYELDKADVNRRNEALKRSIEFYTVTGAESEAEKLRRFIEDQIVASG
ncbi:protein kinase domain-containing protein [Balneola sp. MJW-20]|uniref:protein kinase domain-containing protein n=1 Tax=Gracilimonas aurantiaca TaxID=3234185 RepID=UPI003466B3BD